VNREWKIREAVGGAHLQKGGGGEDKAVGGE